jgi:regulator of sigma D
MARRFKKVWGVVNKKSDKPKHNWSNDGGSRRRMLDMKREKYFRFDLEQILDKAKNKDNKNIIAATVTNTAAKDSTSKALDYVDRLDEKNLEKDIANEVKKLLEKYSKIR